MKQHLTIFTTTCLVGFGVGFGLWIITTAHGLLGEANESLYGTLSMASRIGGVVAAGFWVMHRARRRPMAIPDFAVLFFSAISLSYLAYLEINT